MWRFSGSRHGAGAIAATAPGAARFLTGTWVQSKTGFSSSEASDEEDKLAFLYRNLPAHRRRRWSRHFIHDGGHRFSPKPDRTKPGYGRADDRSERICDPSERGSGRPHHECHGQPGDVQQLGESAIWTARAK